MKNSQQIRWSAWLLITVPYVVGFTRLVSADESIAPDSKLDAARISSPQTVDEARRQAQILHTAIHSSLRVVHDRYYREDEGLPIPAAVMGEIFRDMESTERVRLRWLAVEWQSKVRR